MIESLILLLPLLVLLILVITIYNGIIGKHNAVDRAWASVLTQERQKNKIIPHVEQMVEQYRMHEASVLKEVTALRSAISDLGNGVDTAKLAQAEQRTTALLKGLQVAVEAYPELKASETYSQVMAEISEQQEQVGAAIRIFNRNVEDFNNAIQMFPGSLVNGLLCRKARIDSFSDSEARGGFDYSPNL
ncbi:LemA family protein [Microbulbifer taiwanensis]|uniref:LemA family protein n=2 Tax=Microbulbifer taiwanensis TaxID=986746 RepID=A0ABW1YJ24_9GAMM|nr:LemA family protein [Microbulbifer taiwanensis]